MEQQAQAEIARVQADAEAAAAAIVAAAEGEARAIKARHLADMLPRLQQERARLLSESRLAVLHAVMAARETLLEEAFTAAHAELARLREQPEYPQYMERLLGEVVDELGHDLRLVVDARDEALMRRIVADLGMQASIASGLHTAGGLEASTQDGRITVRNTLEERLHRSRRYLRREIASILSAEDVSWKATTATPMPAFEP
jgi:vacuolar-type H+-ATPase subunit E/Vma4